MSQEAMMGACLQEILLNYINDDDAFSKPFLDLFLLIRKEKE